ncbi:hypothetical protein JCM9140_3451 [Halalkalibacter wakoensis JCM 9140]|uniref:Uncharacterized protein n=1 Tax=Halalkalibacter wakoensis JCM 9140 TaxID=1236970 RepID=W4Q5P8_9BACI|nr:hypothetical protein JCM9140_3451 [Halalkalibacter wakoensis JCM 9140]
MNFLFHFVRSNERSRRKVLSLLSELLKRRPSREAIADGEKGELPFSLCAEVV